MDTTIKETLVKAINLLKSGDKQSAAPLLASVLKKEPSLVQAWYLLGLAVDSEAQKKKAFSQALKLDPSHEKARLALTKLETFSAAVETETIPEADVSPQEDPALTKSGKSVSTDRLDQTQLENKSADLDETEFEPLSQSESPIDKKDPDLEFKDENEIDPGFEAQPFSDDKFVPEEEIQESSDDFSLPSWMTESSFDPGEYQAGKQESDIYQNSEEDIPEWARKNPFSKQETAQPREPESEPEPTFDTDRAVWANSIPTDDQPESEEAYEPLYGAPDDRDFTEEDEITDDYLEDESDTDRIAAFFQQEDSIAEGGEAPEEPDWLRGTQAQEDDKKIGRKELTPSQKKQRRKVIFRILLTILLIGGTAAGYIFREELRPYLATVKPYTDKVVNPVQTWVAPVTDLLTQGAPLTYLLTPDFNITPTVTNTPPAQPTAAPTRTPQPTKILATATLQPGLGVNQTPTATPVSMPLPDEIITMMEQIESQIMILRGLSGPNGLDRELLNESKLRQDMENQLLDPEYLSEFEDDQIVLQALGLVRENVNMADALLNTFADANGGFYSPTNKKIYLLGNSSDGFGSLEQYVYALEYVHALQDDNFNLNNLGYYPKCKQSEQACQAINALVKGEAALVNQLWLEKHPPQIGLQDIEDFDPDPTLFGPDNLPPFFSKDATFGTIHGLAFVQYLYENGGWNAVNRAFNILPSTTEQILHPEKYQQREDAGSIVYPSYTALLSQEWELIREDTLGEWYSYLVLGYNDYPNAQVQDNEAAIAASGWSADRYQVFYNPEQEQTFLSVYWIWESIEDGNQFYAALQTSLNGRFGGAPEQLPEGGLCWSFGGEKTCVQQNGQKIYWLLSENAEMVDQIRDRFSLFP